MNATVSGAFSRGSVPIDVELVARIRSAYQLSSSQTGVEISDLWTGIVRQNSDIDEALRQGNGHIPALDAPADNNLFYGFDNTYKAFTDSMKGDLANRDAHIALFVKTLNLLAEAVGAKRVANPEFIAATGVREPAQIPVDVLISAIEKRIGIELKFPNPFPDEFGIPTARGIASYRAIQAIYQAWRIKQLTDAYGSRVLEIGAGLGRTAYYARLFGITHYTIVDIAQTNVSQANFLGRVLGRNKISLMGEPLYAGQVKIATVDWLTENPEEEFDVIVNVDSLTEMSRPVALGYAEMAMKRGRVLLSINHEANADTVASLEPLAGRLMGRFPYWMRPGYQEEIFRGDRADTDRPIFRRIIDLLHQRRPRL